MSKQSTNQPKPKDYLAYTVYRVFEAGLRFLPVELVWTVGYALGGLGWICMRQRRRTVIRNLRIAYGTKLGHSEAIQMARQTFCRAGANLLCSFRSTTMSQKELRDRVRVKHVERLNAVQAQGDGCILLLAHMGNWEVLTQLPVILYDAPVFGTLYRPLDNPLIDRLVRRRRQEQGVRTYSRRDGFFKPTSHLKEGGFLGVLADQHAGRHGMALPLFGKLGSVTNLPALLYRRSGSPITPIAMSTTGPGRWQLDILPILEVPEDQRKDTHNTTRTTTTLYERILTESPTDVLWMHNYWRVGQRRPLNIDGLQKEEVHATVTQPFRVLVYTDKHDSSDHEMVNQLKRLQNYRPDIHITTAGKHPMLPSVDHHIYCDPTEPPHLTSNAIRSYDQESPAPIDCALDFTAEGSGGKLLIRAGLTRVFCRRGKWMSKRTQTFFSKHNDRSISLFLTSLGLDDTASTR